MGNRETISNTTATNQNLIVASSSGVEQDEDAVTFIDRDVLLRKVNKLITKDNEDEPLNSSLSKKERQKLRIH